MYRFVLYYNEHIELAFIFYVPECTHLIVLNGTGFFEVRNSLSSKQCYALSREVLQTAS